MQLILSRAVLWVFILLSLIFPFKFEGKPAYFASTITLESPSACPLSGCAAGQRLNLRNSFDLSVYQNGSSPNVQFCVYTPINWAAENLTIGNTGLLSNQAYTVSATQCGTPPAGYEILGGTSASLEAAYFGDSLDFSLRIGKTAVSDGSILTRIFENDGSSWQQTQQAFILIPVDSINTFVYTANQAADCDGFSPCFLNSKDDELNGFGTGLKDAVDAVDSGAIIQILGTYPVKSNTVLINKTVTLQGSSQSSLTYTGSSCTLPMLKLQNGGTIRSLTINDGSCFSPNNRDLVLIESNQNVTLEHNRFSGGKNAVMMANSTGNLLARFNHFEENSAYAILNQNPPGAGRITAIANNFVNQISPLQVLCANNGTVNHNFWGTSITPATAASGCAFTEGRHLGSAISSNAGGGLNVVEITVTGTRTSYFNNQISVQHASGQPDFNLYIINHGNQSTNAPFQSAGSSMNLVPCNDYYDLFLAGTTPPPSTLRVSFKYDANPSCVAVVESSEYCGQSNPTFYPLWWYDPLQTITIGWDRTGQNPTGPLAGGATGQTTTCQVAQNEITVEIDSTGRPGIGSDLFNLPIVAGVIGQSASAVLSQFDALGQDMRVQITWETSSELNTSGFYVQRSLVGQNNFSRISPFLARQGTNTSGAEYEFLDTNVFNLIGYDYRLEIVGTDVLSTFSGIRSTTPIPATATPTVTVTGTITSTVTITTTPMPPSITPTFTQTPTITTTPTITITPTRTISLTPTVTPTRTITPTRTRTRFSTATNTRTPYWTPYRTRTSTRTPFITRTPITTQTITPSRSVTSAGIGPDRDTTTTPTPFSNNGYPQPGSATDDPTQPTKDGTVSPENGYPVSEKTPSPDSTSDIKETPPTGSTGQPHSTSQPGNETDSKTNKTVGYVILGSMSGLSLLMVAAFILWKKKIISLPF